MLAGRGEVCVRCSGSACENRCNADRENFKFSGSGSTPEDINDFFSIVSCLIRLCRVGSFLVQVRQASFPDTPHDAHFHHHDCIGTDTVNVVVKAGKMGLAR